MTFHTAIIMDGNGRWAENRGLPRAAGHKKGVETTKRIVECAPKLGVTHLTLFGFSTENWKRPASEIKELMSLLRFYLRAEAANLHANNVCVRMIGCRTGIDKDIIDLIEDTEEKTKANTGLYLTIALDYGGRQDIVNATKKLILDNVTADNVTEDLFEEYLSTRDLPSPDLLIRTSGEHRISNFLLWQCAYSEIVISDTLWPDFDQDDLAAAINDFKGRDRRYGALSDDAKAADA